MPYNERERRIRAAARQRGIVGYRTKSLPGGKYAVVTIVRKPGDKGGHTVMGTPQQKGT